MPDEPPATEAGGSAVSPICRSIARDVAAQRVGGDLRQRRPGAGADVDGADLHGVAARPARARCGRRCRAWSSRGIRRRAATPVPTSQLAVERVRAGVGSRGAQPNRSAPSRRHSTSLRFDHGLPVSGSTCGFVADPQLDRVDVAGDGELVHRDLEARTCRGTRPARASRTARARRAARAGAWSCGSARRTSSAIGDAVCSANSLTVAVCSTTSWLIAVSRAVALARRAGCAGWSACGSRRASNICCRVSASFTGRPAARCAAIAASTSCECGSALGPEPAADVLGDRRGPARGRGRTRSRAPAAPACTPCVESYSVSRGRRRRVPQRDGRRAAPSGCCARAASCTSGRRRRRAAASAASTSPSEVSVG